MDMGVAEDVHCAGVDSVCVGSGDDTRREVRKLDVDMEFDRLLRDATNLICMMNKYGPKTAEVKAAFFMLSSRTARLNEARGSQRLRVRGGV